MPPKPSPKASRPVLAPLNLKAAALPQEAERLKYWNKYLSSDPKEQANLRKDITTFRRYVWAGVPDDVRPRLWQSVVPNDRSVSSDHAKVKFLQQLEPLTATYNLFVPESKQLTQTQINTINMVLRFSATSLELETLIDGSFNVLAAAVQHVPQFTPLLQLFIHLYNANGLFWRSSIKEVRALQTFALTSLGVFHRDRPTLLDKLSQAGLDLSDIPLLAKQWIYSFGAQSFPFSFTQRVIDIVLLDTIGPAAHSAIFMGCLLHWEELVSPQPLPRQLGVPTRQHQQNNNMITTMQSLHDFPNHPNLNIENIFSLAFAYFVDRYPNVELTFLDTSWTQLLQRHKGTGFQLCNNPWFTYLIQQQQQIQQPPTPVNIIKPKYSDMTMTPKERLHYLFIANPVFESDELFPQYTLLHNQLHSMPSYSPIGGYNTLPLRLQDVGKVLASINRRFNDKRLLLFRRYLKACPNQFSTVSNPGDDTINMGSNNNNNNNNNHAGKKATTKDPTKVLQPQLGILFKNLQNFSKNLKKINSLSKSSTPTQDKETNILLRSSEKDLNEITNQLDPVLKVMSERVALQLYDLPATIIHPQDVSDITSSQIGDFQPIEGVIHYNQLAYYLTRPYLCMEGHLFLAELYSDIITGTKGGPNGDIIDPINSGGVLLPKGSDLNDHISAIRSRFFVLQGPFLLEYEDMHSTVPIGRRCVDLRGRSIVVDKTLGDYGHGITIYHSASSQRILFQLYTPQRGEFERWLASLSAAIALTGNSKAQFVPNQPPTPSSHATTPSSAASSVFGPSGTLKMNANFGPTGTVLLKPPPQQKK
jgi:hypothetical protein